MITSFCHPPNLKKLLTSAKLPTDNQPNMCNVSKCKRDRCKCCLHIIEGDTFVFSHTNTRFKVSCNFNCLSKYVVYVLVCNNCQQYYIGLTTNHLCSRMTVHRQQIQNTDLRKLKVSKHIASCSKHLDIKFAVFPFFQVKNESLTVLRRKESFFINKFCQKLYSD